MDDKPEITDSDPQLKDVCDQLEEKTLALEEKERTIMSLLAELEVADHDSKKNLAELERLTARVDQLSVKESQLNNILNSRAWRWVSRYGRLKKRYLEPAYPHPSNCCFGAASWIQASRFSTTAAVAGVM